MDAVFLALVLAVGISALIWVRCGLSACDPLRWRTVTDAEPARSFLIDRSKLPPLYPTHRHDPAFWCSLGRAVATFGYLEEMLKKAVFALTGSREAPADEEERAAAMEKWYRLLAQSVRDPLNPLIKTFIKVAREHPELRIENFEDFVQQLEAAAKIRNVICHGSWGAPDENGASVPFYVTGKPGEQEVFETPVSVAWLDQLQAHTAELACEVVNTVTHMGYQFPGGTGLGRPVGSSFEMTSQDSEGAAPDAEQPAHQPESVLHGVAENMREMFNHHSQQWPDAVKLVDDALTLLQRCGWESWQADGINAEAERFEIWRAAKTQREAFGDPEVARKFPLFITGSALSQALPNVSIGLARATLICMHGFFAQARSAFRATVEECLYAFMIFGDPERGRQYLADSRELWRASTALRRTWERDSQSTDKATHDTVPHFGLTFTRIYQQHIHSGSHGGFEQSSHRTQGSSQAFVDVNSNLLGAYPVSFTAAVLELVNDLVPMHNQVDREVWQAGYAAFHKAKSPILNQMRE